MKRKALIFGTGFSAAVGGVAGHRLARRKNTRQRRQIQDVGYQRGYFSTPGPRKKKRR